MLNQDIKSDVKQALENLADAGIMFRLEKRGNSDIPSDPIINVFNILDGWLIGPAIKSGTDSGFVIIPGSNGDVSSKVKDIHHHYHEKISYVTLSDNKIYEICHIYRHHEDLDYKGKVKLFDYFKIEIVKPK